MKWIDLILRQIALVFINVAVASVSAQTAPSALGPTHGNSASQSVASISRQPVVDPAVELKGAGLVKELRRGGFVLYMRHAINGPGSALSGSPCANGESPLTDEGRSQAQAVGRALRALDIRLGRVSSSLTCRARMTAELVAQKDVELLIDLNPVDPTMPRDWVALRQAVLNSQPVAGTNALLVSHFHGAPNPVDRLFLDMAEIIVFSPNALGKPLAIARIPHTAWTELLRSNDSIR
ncbi:MAG: histidine phosphatase family protein [Rhodoferax sp.]